jgi:N-acylneuraminate cytidylyltransferase
VTHADTTIKNHFRKDYSSYHVVSYDPAAGEVEKRQTSQGYADESAWARGQSWDAFSLLRPTSPFRTAATIRRAWTLFSAQQGVDSLRAVELCAQHPGKMWIVRGTRMLPLLPFGSADRPWHSTPYQALPEVYVQNASLEIAWTRVVLDDRSIAGTVIVPFMTEGYEGFDINVQEEWWIAERMLETGAGTLPQVAQDPYPEAEPRK